MKSIYFKITAALLLLALLWVQAEPVASFAVASFWEYRSAFVQLSGIIAIALMTIVIVLALRLPFIENFTKGLDKSYHLHKWIGISSLIAAIIHWLCATAPKYAVGFGLLTKPEHAKPLLQGDSFYSTIAPLRHSAEALGEWFFYGMLVLGAISLLNRIGYKFFKFSHKLMAISFIVMAYHGAVLLKHAYWSYPITYVTLIIIAIGVLAAVWSLMGKIGKKRSYDAVVSSHSHDDNNQVTDLRLLVPGWQGHNSGQFAYLNFGGKNIHPFTIASQDKNNGELRFLIKELGDFTRNLKYQLHEGQAINIEGPYGRFDFNDAHDQIWIAGGIGIAAFKATLQSAQESFKNRSITLYYCTENPSEKLILELQQEAKLANIDLNIIDGSRGSLLSVAKLSESHKDLKARSIWFCGPVGFSDQLKQDLNTIDYDLNLFHQELFSMR
jgi:predicted ferric reductase